MKIQGPASVENTPFADYSIRKRVYNVKFSGNPVFFLSPQKEKYLSSEPIFIKLGEDVVPGTYSITLGAPEPIFVHLSQLKPGLHNKRSVLLEITE